MDGYSSGLASNYSQAGNQYISSEVGTTGYYGVNQAGNTMQSADISQLQPGDVFQGEVVSVNGQDVQIELTNGQYLAAKLERDVQIALGQMLNFEVKSNKDNKIILRQSDNAGAQLLRVGEAALRTANLSVNEKNLKLVADLIENGMPIDKKTLMSVNRLLLQHPQAEAGSIMKMVKLNIPVNDNNISQFHNYQNMQHRLAGSIDDVSNEIIKIYDNMVKMSDTCKAVENVSDTGLILNNNDASNKFMEQIIEVILSDEAEDAVSQSKIVQNSDSQNNAGRADSLIQSEDTNTNVDTNKADNAEPSQVMINRGDKNIEVLQNEYLKKDSEITQGRLDDNISERNIDIKANEADKTNTTNYELSDNKYVKNDSIVDSVNNELKNNYHEEIIEKIKRDLSGDNAQKADGVADKIINLIKADKINIKDVKNIIDMLLPEHKNKIFNSSEFKGLIRKSLQKQWSISPEELIKEDGIKNLYQKLSRQSNKLAQLMNDIAGAENSANNRAINNLKANVDFINQMNQMFNYVQLPLRLSGSQAHGDLYVYTNKKKLSAKGGTLTAFLHLDMEHLGSMDINISLQTDNNKVTTKFSLEEDSIELIEEHIDELTKGLEAKGYICKNIVEKMEKDCANKKSVIDNIEEQVVGRSAPLSYQTFDIRT